MRTDRLLIVMPALVAGIHVFTCRRSASKTSMIGKRPAVTRYSGST